jgi:hypothetical protein
VPFTTSLTQIFIDQAYWDPATELVKPSAAGVPTPGDGTQIWKITHNGVDTHPIHFHLFDVQLLNRVGWDGAIRLPDHNELGWKDTIRISPLEDTIVAVRSVPPKMPFGIPDSLRPLNPALPLGVSNLFTNLNPANGQQMTTLNAMKNFGWEYVWHCHILSHEEQDMMRPVTLDVLSITQPPAAPTNAARQGTGDPAVLSWTDATPVVDPNNPANMGNLANEIGFRIERSPVPVTTYTTIGTALANATTFTLPSTAPNVPFSYRVVAYNAKAEASSAPVTITQGVTPPPTAPSVLAASAASATSVNLTWNDNSNNETGFVVERAGDATFALIQQTFTISTPNTSTYTDTTVSTPNTEQPQGFAARGSPGPVVLERQLGHRDRLQGAEGAGCDICLDH